MNEESLFHLALEKPAHERATFLDGACGGNVELRQRVERLLKAHDNPGSFLRESVFPSSGQSGGETTQALDPGGAFSGSGAKTQSEQDRHLQDDLAFLVPSTRAGALGRLEHYHILQVIGKGGFGTVLKAFDEKLHRVVAIKVLSLELAASGTARQRFIREARTAAAVTHEHVVTIHAVVEEHRPPFLVMQLIDGVTLQEKLDKVGMLGLREILRIGMQMAEGLAAAHKQGLVHRDIKPANILLENGVERVKITDFGLAKIADDASVTQSGVVAGTPMYMSPEQANGEPLDHRSDLFSLGTVLYVMCTGRPPFRATGTMGVLKRVIEDAPRPVREINPEIPDWLEEIINKLHAKKAADRFQTAREVAEVLGQRLADVQAGREIIRAGSVGDGPATPDKPVAHASGSSGKRGKWALINAFLVLALLMAAGWWYAPTISRYTRGVGKVVLDANADEVQYLLLRKGGETVKLAPTAEGIEIPPGDHELEAVPAAGRVIARVEQRRRPHFNFTSTRGMPGARGKVSLARGEEVRIQVTTEQAPQPTVKEPPVEPAWVPLFNGKDLTGWIDQNPENKAWKIEEGILHARGYPSTLTTTRHDFGDFHLRLEMKTDSLTRATLHPRTDGVKGLGHMIWLMGVKGKYTPFSLARDLKTVQKAKPFTASEGDWLQLEILARGNQFTIQVNGAPVLDWTDPEPAKARGAILLTQLSECGPMQIRKIEIKELPPSPLKAEIASDFTLVSRFGSEHQTPVLGLGVTADGRRALSVAAFSSPFNLVAWELNATGGKAVHRETFKGNSYCAAITPAGDCAVVGGNGTVEFWDLKAMKLNSSTREHGDMVWGLAISGDGKRAITGAHNDDFICIWELPGGKLLKKLPLDFKSVLSVAITPDGKQVLLGSYGGKCDLWDLENGEKVRRIRAFQPGAGGIRKTALSRDGRRLLIAVPLNGEYPIQLWDVGTGKQLQEFKGHGHYVGGVRFLPDGEHFLSGAQDGTLRVWSVNAGKEVARFTDAELFVNSLELLPDGRHFLTGGGMIEESSGKKANFHAGDHDLRLWQLPKSVWPTSSPSPVGVAVPAKVADFGAWIDPRGDCRHEFKDGVLTITVPPGVHKLDPKTPFAYAGIPMNSKNQDAPRLLREVEGDFTLEVHVGDIKRKAPEGYLGAGLVLWQDEDHFLKVLRRPDGALVLAFAKGKFVGGMNSSGTSPIALRIERKGKTCVLQLSKDGKDWLTLNDTSLAKPFSKWPLPKKLRVGILAESDFPQAVDFVFERFQLTTAADAGAWVPLFTGKDLAAWEVNKANEGVWSIDKDVLIGVPREKPPYYVYSRRADFSNFHLRLQAKLEHGGSGGVHLRLPKTGAGTWQGIAVKLLHNARGELGVNTYVMAPPNVSVGGGKHFLKPDHWFDLELIVNGRKFEGKLDGASLWTRDLSAAELSRIDPSGCLGLEVGDSRSRLLVRHVEIRELPPTPERFDPKEAKAR